jgi:hypothetical protein
VEQLNTKEKKTSVMKWSTTMMMKFSGNLATNNWSITEIFITESAIFHCVLKVNLLPDST